jgi:hypothetical protein
MTRLSILINGSPHGFFGGSQAFVKGTLFFFFDK